MKFSAVGDTGDMPDGVLCHMCAEGCRIYMKSDEITPIVVNMNREIRY